MDGRASGCTAFHGNRKVASGSYAQVAVAVRALVEREPGASVLIFDDETGRQIDFDLRGSDQDVAVRLGEPDREDSATARRPGRPKLGVIAREVTLLPRHWEWLSAQPGGASVALRKLVEAARTSKAGAMRRSQEAADRFMMAMAGNLPHYEDAARALYAGDERRFVEMTSAWPADLSAHARRLATKAFSVTGDAPSRLDTSHA